MVNDAYHQHCAKFSIVLTHLNSETPYKGLGIKTKLNFKVLFVDRHDITLYTTKKQTHISFYYKTSYNLEMLIMKVSIA